MSQDRVDVTELPESILKKSPTWLRYADECGRCHRCHEMTGLLDPCCGASVDFEGGTKNWEDLWNQIEEELCEQAEAQYYDQEEEPK